MSKNGHYSDIDDKKTEDFIWEKMSEAADAYEAELNADSSLDDVCLTPEMMEDMMQRIAEEDEKNAKSAEMLLSEDDREALELGRKTRARRKKSRKILLRAGVAAAVLAIIFGGSMSIEANRIKLLNVWNFLQGKEAVLRIENDEEEGDYDAELQEAYADILAKTGIRAVMFKYVPQEMRFNNYIVGDSLEDVLMFYQYEDTILTVDMVKKSEQTQKTQLFDGEVLENFEIETKFGTVPAMEIADPDGARDHMAQIIYDNCQYAIYGALSREEFVKMIEHMNFY